MKQIDDLRDHLFATLEKLRDPKNPMDLERARTIAQVGQTIVNSAKVEVDYMKATGGNGSGFIPDRLPAPKGDGKSHNGNKLPPGTTVRTHRLLG